MHRYLNGIAAGVCLCLLACANPGSARHLERATAAAATEPFASPDGRVSGMAPDGSTVVVVRSGDGYELALRRPGVDATCHISEGRDRPVSSAVFEAAGRRVAADLKGKLAEGSVHLQFRTESERPIQYRLAGPRPLLFGALTLSAEHLPSRRVDVAGAMFPNSILACYSNNEGHEPNFADVLSALVEKLAVDIPPREAPSVPHYTEAELVRFDDGEIGLREVLVHRTPGGFLTSFYESASSRSGVADRIIYEIAGDDGQLARSHFIFYRDGKRQLQFVLERVGPTEYRVAVEDQSRKSWPPRVLRSSTPLLARMKMALDLRDAGRSAGSEPRVYEVFVPEIAREALVSVRISQPGTEEAPPKGMKRIGSSSVVMQAGSLSLSRAYGYPTVVDLAAPPRITGALGK